MTSVKTHGARRISYGIATAALLSTVGLLTACADDTPPPPAPAPVVVAPPPPPPAPAPTPVPAARG